MKILEILNDDRTMSNFYAFLGLCGSRDLQILASLMQFPSPRPHFLALECTL